MKPCDQNAVQTFLYVDNELSGDELAAFESHLNVCAACRGAVAQERQFLNELRSVGPLYRAPAELRSSVETLLLDLPMYTAPPDLRARIRKTLERPRFNRPRWQSLAVAAALVLLAIVSGLLFLRPPAHSELAVLATTAHKRYVRGEFALQIHSASPQIVSGWLNERMPLHLKLPGYDEMPELVHPVQLKGGGLLGFRKSGAAYVVYHVRNKPVSLVAVSSSVCKPSGGKRVDMKPLSFYYDSVDGYNVITWLSKSGLVTYAMVSDGGERAQQSCIVCHATSSAKDRKLMSGLLAQ
jgi:anti-sigma factor RsiW